MNPKKIIIGTELFSGSRNTNYYSKDIEKFLSNALKLGVNQIDTAPSYGKNSSVEKLIGKALKNNRGKYIISSKFLNNHFSSSSKRLDNLKQNFENSLKNLDTDYIDNYFFHSGLDKDFFDINIWNYLNDLKNKKCIHNLGLALRHELVKKNSLSQIKKSKDFGIKIISTTLNIFSNESLNCVIPYCKKNKIKVWGRMPLAKGLLTGRYKSINEISKNDSRVSKEKKISEIIIEFAKKNKINTSKAIKWTSNHSDAVIIGFKNLNQLKIILKL